MGVSSGGREWVSESRGEGGHSGDDLSKGGRGVLIRGSCKGLRRGVESRSTETREVLGVGGSWRSSREVRCKRTRQTE